MVDVRAIGVHTAGLAWLALRVFIGTMVVTALGGVLLAGISCHFVRNEHWMYVVIAGLLVLVEAAVIGVVLGWKRAQVLTLAHGLGSLRLGRSLVRLVFGCMIEAVSNDGAEPGVGRLARGLERIPLARAQELLEAAIGSVLGSGDQRGWLRQRVRQRLLQMVRKYTLTRFREEAAGRGGIDLVKVKEELEETLDDAVVQKLRKPLRFATALVIVGFPLVVAVQTWGIVMLSRLMG
ncbi:MAG: hypothetical protein RBS80_23540 [Thermoguttaceae bacterium]|jgi:hypothetical protein|nr:hypothetical protein [Thermoguttaceae bacterium]